MFNISPEPRKIANKFSFWSINIDEYLWNQKYSESEVSFDSLPAFPTHFDLLREVSANSILLHTNCSSQYTEMRSSLLSRLRSQLIIRLFIELLHCKRLGKLCYF